MRRELRELWCVLVGHRWDPGGHPETLEIISSGLPGEALFFGADRESIFRVRHTVCRWCELADGRCVTVIVPARSESLGGPMPKLTRTGGPQW